MTRTRGNGSELSWDGLEADIRLMAEHAEEYPLGVTAHELRNDAQELARRSEGRLVTQREAFDEGFQQGARIEHAAAVAAAANALLNILGKDAGDGLIDLGAAGTWGFDSWTEHRWVPAAKTRAHARHTE
ncbi:MAG: hypothetical protein V4510_13035 [bacterium]